MLSMNSILTLTGRSRSARAIFIGSIFWIVGVWTFSLFVQSLASGPWAAGAPPDRRSWAFASSWDARRYQEIARDGYENADAFTGITNFYPLYPLLMRLVAVPIATVLPLPLAVVVSGMSISLIAFLGSIVLLFRLFRGETDTHTTVRALIYVLVFPTAFFFFTIYTESLYLLFSVAMFTFLERKRWILAGFVGGLASLTRPVGVTLLVPLLVFFLSGGERRWSVMIRSVVLFLCLYALLPIFMWITFGDPWRYMTGASAWGLYPPFSIHHVIENVRSEGAQALAFFRTGFVGTVILAQHAVSVTLGIAAAVWCWKKSLFARSGYCAMGVFLPIVTGDLFGEARYVTVLFPIFLMIATVGRRLWFHRAFVSMSLSLFLLNVVFFTSGAWVS